MFALLTQIEIQDDAGETALWVCVLFKHKDLSSDPRWVCQSLGGIGQVVITLPGETGGWQMANGGPW